MDFEWEIGLSNEFNLTRLAAKIIRENLRTASIDIGNLIVREFHARGVVIKFDTEPEDIKRDDGLNYYYGDEPSHMYDDGWRMTEPLIK